MFHRNRCQHPIFYSFSFSFQDQEAQREFDELMRSSTTMKVSLTPDRLKSMEVCGTVGLMFAYQRLTYMNFVQDVQAGEEA
jgi:hypothetical protein